jgi:hypothetical protein
MQMTRKHVKGQVMGSLPDHPFIQELFSEAFS